MTTTKSRITLATFKVRFLSVLAIRRGCYLNSYLPFVINHRNRAHSYGAGGTIPFAIRSSVNQNLSVTLYARNVSRLVRFLGY